MTRAFLGRLLLLALFYCAGGHAFDPNTSWDLYEVAASSEDPVVLRDRGGATVSRVPASTIRFLYIVTTDLLKISEIDADVYLTKGNTPNAAAGVMSGRNTILVNLGMLKMIGQDMHQWAAVIGHEIAHVKLAHMSEKVDRTGPVMILEAIVQSQLPDPGYRQITDMAFQAFETKYSRDAERESDYLGAIWAVEAGYNPYGSVLVHESLRRLGSEHPVPFLSSHPSGSERIRTLKQLSDRLGGSPYEVDNDQ